MPTIIRNNLSNEATSTVIAYPVDGARCFGEDAASKQITKPAETVVDLAPWLFGSSSVSVDTLPHIGDAAATSTCSDTRAVRVIGEKETHPVQATAFFLKNILQFAPPEKRGEMRVCMSVPTSASPTSIVSLRQAGLLAGVDPARLLVARSDEAMAVYFHHMQYGALDEEKPTYVTVLDIGQSCCCGCVLAVTKTRVEKLAVESIKMGSGYIDAVLCRHIYDVLEQKHATKLAADDVKTLRRILRECRKAKEILSTVDETKVQLEGLPGDIDVAIPLSRSVVERAASPLLDALRGLLSSLQAHMPSPENAEEERRVEVIGGGWRTVCMSDLIKQVFHISRVGVSLDANLAVAEGSAILAEVYDNSQASAQPTPAADEETATEGQPKETATTAATASREGHHPIHSVQLVGFELTDPSALARQPLSSQEEEAVKEWQAAEDSMAAVDAAIHLRLAAVNRLDTFVLQTLNAVEACSAAEAKKKDAQTYLFAIDDYVRGDCDGHDTVAIEAKLEEVKAHVVKEFPEVEQYYEAVRAEEKRKEEELHRLSLEQKDEDEDNLKSDPQRLRMGQKRREQGQTLFRQEHWAEAQTRFVQALACVGGIYDTANEENMAKKNEISISCHLNIASCSVKLGLWRNAVNNCTSVLELSPDNAKALFRRGQAQLALKEYAEAVKDLERARVLSKEDPAVVAELTRAKAALDAEKAKEKKMFAKMFS